ncbi:MAG: peptide chain release factor-like protein [Deltaproteobacteria bacterium]|nr:peptide chain release factor-like protein [Deltaproteobacteria bacterium]
MNPEIALLDARLAALGIDPNDLVERFIRAGGPGGQHVNKTSTAVQLSHPPSDLEVRAEGERSQLQNRIAAREQLIERIEAQRAKMLAARRDARERERRRHRRPSRAARRRNVETKRKRGEVKRLRGKVHDD